MVKRVGVPQIASTTHSIEQSREFLGDQIRELLDNVQRLNRTLEAASERVRQRYFADQ